MLSFLKFYKFWGFFFLDLKFFKFKNLLLLKNIDTKIEIVLCSNDLLGMPEIFFSFLNKNFKSNAFVYNNRFLASKYKDFFFKTEFFFIFFLNSNLINFLSKNYCFTSNSVDLFYSNFNIFSINFLFKLKYFMFFNRQISNVFLDNKLLSYIALRGFPVF